jgi:hypothetical protein
MNDLATAYGMILCHPCAAARVAEQPGDDPSKIIQNLQDPTVCAQCHRDNGIDALKTVAKVPLCEQCAQKFFPPFPAWVKASLAVVLVLAAVELTRNWRFFQAYAEIPHATAAFTRGDVPKAHALMQQACMHVPEDARLAVEDKFLHAICLMQERQLPQAMALLREVKAAWGKEAQAVDFFMQAIAIMEALDTDGDANQAMTLATRLRNGNPGNKMASDLFDSAQVAQAFENKDYDQFLALAQEQFNRTPDNASGAGMVASAFACKYAVTGDGSFKQQSLDYIAKAHKLKGGQALQEYEERVMYRLNTRQIISRSQYDQKFRQASTKEGK